MFLTSFEIWKKKKKKIQLLICRIIISSPHNYHIKMSIAISIENKKDEKIKARDENIIKTERHYQQDS